MIGRDMRLCKKERMDKCPSAEKKEEKEKEKCKIKMTAHGLCA
jgi:hypothetical protein